MRQYTKQVKCHTYPSRVALLKQWAGEEKVSVSTYFRNVIASHAFKKSGYEDPAPLTRKRQLSKYPRLAGLGYVYLIRCGESYKIGRAVDVLKRIGTMSLPMRPEIIATKCCADYGQLEKKLHCLLSKQRVYGEWFRFSEEELEEVKKHFE